MEIEYTVSLAGLGTEYEISTKQSVQFRPCSDGEILSANQCFRCQNGTYSLKYSPDAKVRYIIKIYVHRNCPHCIFL